MGKNTRIQKEIDLLGGLTYLFMGQIFYSKGVDHVDRVDRRSSFPNTLRISKAAPNKRQGSSRCAPGALNGNKEWLVFL